MDNFYVKNLLKTTFPFSQKEKWVSPILSKKLKSLAEFAAEAANKVKVVFGRGMYVDKNTSQAASVEFVCCRQTNYARSRLQESGGKSRRDFPPR